MHGTAAAPRDSVLVAQRKAHASAIGATVRKRSHHGDAMIAGEKRNRELLYRAPVVRPGVEGLALARGAGAGLDGLDEQVC